MSTTRSPDPDKHLSSLLFLAAAGLGTALAFGIASPTPASADTDKRAEGAEVFATNGCAHCHGPEGLGTERGPSLRDVRKRLKPDAIQHQIVAGGGAMPAFGEVLTPPQIGSLVTFLRAKKWVSAAPVPSPAPTPAPGPAPGPAPAATPSPQ